MKKVKVKLKSFSISFEGGGEISSMKLANKMYDANFEDAAVWLRNSQKDDGTWPIEVEKELDYYETVRMARVNYTDQK